MSLLAGMDLLTGFSGEQAAARPPWALAQEAPARQPCRPCKPLARGPLVLVLKPRTGGLQRQRIAAVRELLELDGREHVLVESGRSLAATAQQAAEHAVAHGGALIALGGDGTVNTVGAAAWRAACPLGVLPVGRSNFFAREHGLSAEPEEAVRCWLQGQVGPTQLGLVNGWPFFVNAAVGRYPRALRQVPQLDQGRRHYRLQADGERLSLRTSLLFFANNRLQLGELGRHELPAAGQLLVLAASGETMVWPRRGSSDTLQSRAFRVMRVWPTSRLPGLRPSLLHLACDGELQRSCEHLQVEAAAQPLCLIGARPP